MISGNLQSFCMSAVLGWSIPHGNLNNVVNVVETDIQEVLG